MYFLSQSINSMKKKEFIGGLFNNTIIIYQCTKLSKNTHEIQSLENAT